MEEQHSKESATCKYYQHLLKSRKKSLNLKFSNNKATEITCMRRNVLSSHYSCKNLPPEGKPPPPSTFEIHPPKPLFIFSPSLFCLTGPFYDLYSRLEKNKVEILKKSKSWPNSKANSV